MARWLYFHEAGVLADAEGPVNFRLTGPSAGEDRRVMLDRPDDCQEVFVGTEEDADAFLAALAAKLGADVVGGTAKGGEDRPRTAPPAGLYGKYLVRYADGSPTSPAARYFVGRYDTDPHARKMVAAYAASCAADKPRLAADLLAELSATLPAFQARQAELEGNP